MKKLPIAALITIGSVRMALCQTTIAAKDASKHIGKTVKICEKVFSGKVISANTTLLYFGGDYPNQAFTAIISGADKSKFKGHPDIDDNGKDFIVTSKLVNYEGKPGVIVTRPDDLKPVLIDNDHIVVFRLAPNH